MGRNKCESEDDNSQSKTCKNSDKDAASNSQTASESVENDRNSSSKKKDGEAGEKAASSSSSSFTPREEVPAPPAAAAHSKQESSSAAVKGDNQAAGGGGAVSESHHREKTAAQPTAAVSAVAAPRLTVPPIILHHVRVSLPEVVVKRGRGRPKKIHTEKAEPPRPKRGRGRPPKSLSQKAAYGVAFGFGSLSASGGGAGGGGGGGAGGGGDTDRGKVGDLLSESGSAMAAESEVVVKDEIYNDYEDKAAQQQQPPHHHQDEHGGSHHNASSLNGGGGGGGGGNAARRTSRSLPFRKSKRRSIPRINLEDFEDDSDDEPVRKKRSTRPKRFPPSGPRLKIVPPSTSKKPRETEQHLTAQVDRLASLVDRLENRINLDGLVDEDTDIETDLEDDVQVLLLQRNFNVKNELKRYFKDIVKAYIEELGAESGCLIASIRSYKNSGKFTVYEIWHAESDQMTFLKKSNNKIFSAETNHMLKTTTVVKTMNIPASWWQRCS